VVADSCVVSTYLGTALIRLAGQQKGMRLSTVYLVMLIDCCARTGCLITARRLPRWINPRFPETRGFHHTMSVGKHIDMRNEQ
jgi:hypothetical protein